jgi:hypothetical protein
LVEATGSEKRENGARRREGNERESLQGEYEYLPLRPS